MTNSPYLIHSLHMVMIFVENALKEILNCPPTLMPQSPLNNMIAGAEEQYTRCSPSEMNKEKKILKYAQQYNLHLCSK